MDRPSFTDRKASRLSKHPTAESLRACSVGERGQGVFAVASFQRGDEVLEFRGPRLSGSQVADFARVIQAGPDLYIGRSGEIDDLVNHSCDPNCRLSESDGRLFLAALRPIAEGEEVTFDYSTSMLEEPWRMRCSCGSPHCRGLIGSFTELPPAIRRRYLALEMVPGFVRTAGDDAASLTRTNHDSTAPAGKTDIMSSPTRRPAAGGNPTPPPANTGRTDARTERTATGGPGPTPSNGWSIEDATELYRVPQWSNGYFSINPRGRMQVHPSRSPERAVDLLDVVDGLAERGIYSPVLLRFTDILADRLHEIRTTFDEAIADHEYRGGFQCVYPVKVNQQKELCEEIAAFGHQLGFGLEAGSKPELLAVMALASRYEGLPIICNGFKDAEYIELAILGQKLGLNIIPVVERFKELEHIFEQAARHGVRPVMGVRVKLAATAPGRWECSSGPRGKFGLSAAELLHATELLRERGMLDCLQLLHAHIGSQVPEIRHALQAVAELAHIYTELHGLGAGLRLIDIGGGLGVDYAGNRTISESSINYTLREYASGVVGRILSSCEDAGIEQHPTIVAESGRAMVAYSSALIFDVLGRNSPVLAPDLERIRKLLEKEDVPQPLWDLLEIHESSDESSLLSVYHMAAQAREEAMTLFRLGHMSLPLRAASEQLFAAIGQQLLDRLNAAEEPPPEELRELHGLLSDTYFCNFSLFQSVPDAWAIDQLFPICPIHRLDERPLVRATLADLTCDSDGRIDRFADRDGEKNTLELHGLRTAPGGNGVEPYYLGVFLVGAYQETLGDLHNLFGDTHAVHVRAGDRNDWEILEVVEGDSVRDVLSYVQYDARDMLQQMRRAVEQAVKAQRLSVSEGKELMQYYHAGMDGYTYLE